jgi:hypothetical protein
MVRGGFAARALTYALIGGLALALALGAGREPVGPDQQGALTLIAKAPLGRVAVLVLALGLLAYAIWKLVQAIFGRGPEGGGGTGIKDRVGNAAGGIAYLAFFAVAISVLIGGGGSDSSEPRQTAAGVLGWPAGPVLIAIAGIVLILVSAYQIVDACQLGFLRDNKTDGLSAEEHESFVHLGRVGLIARSLVFALVGYFLVRTAIEFKPARAVGVDGALYRVYNEPYGPWLLGFVATGLLVFAAFSVFEARHRQL